MPTDRNHYRPTLEDALDAHEQVLRSGGRHGVINLGSVKSAIARPCSDYYPDICSKAAALVESVVTNHGFADGNKRTAVIFLNLLLERSGYRLVPSTRTASIQDEVENMVLEVAKGTLSFNDLVAWFAIRTRPM